MVKSKEIVRKMAVAMGGFIIFVGIVLLGIFSLTFFGVLEPDLLIGPVYRLLFVYVLLILSIIDLISGILLLKG